MKRFARPIFPPPRFRPPAVVPQIVAPCCPLTSMVASDSMPRSCSVPLFGPRNHWSAFFPAAQHDVMCAKNTPHLRKPSIFAPSSSRAMPWRPKRPLDVNVLLHAASSVVSPPLVIA